MFYSRTVLLTTNTTFGLQIENTLAVNGLRYDTIRYDTILTCAQKLTKSSV